MFCTNCGNDVGVGKKFCTNCGMAINHASSHVPTTETPLPKISSGRPWWFEGPYKWLAISVGVATLITLIVTYYPKNNTKSQDIQQSVVDILCDTDYGGSGTIFTDDGTILTNNHVIEGATTCQITIPDPATGGISEIYNASPIIVPTLSKKYDVATLKIDGAYTDSKGKTWGTYPATFKAFSLPNKCDPSSPSKLGDSVRIYGYPITSGGYNLTITDGLISSFADDGNILTSAQIDSGNSGGLAVDQNGCWLGIPSAVVSGNYQNLGVIIPGDIVETLFLQSVPAKVNPAAANESSSVSVGSDSLGGSNDEVCQRHFGTYSEWSGQMDTKGKPTCECQKDYSWDATGNACATKTSLKQECKATFGFGSYSHTQDGKAVCGCLDGYQLNNAETSCVVIPVTPVIVSPVSTVSGCVIGAEYSSTSGLSCDGNGSCSSGLFLDKNANECVSPPMYCMRKYGAYSSYNSTDNTCGCDAGYSFNRNGLCAQIKSGYQVCSDAFPNETWDGTYSADGKYNCVCKAGYTWNSYSQSCY